MPEETAAATSTSGGGGQSGTSHLPWHLVPSFKPGETCVNEYTRRLEFLANVWPLEHLSQLAPRACLLCEGTAFQKVVRLDPLKLKVQSLDGIKLVVQTLGGVWGQSKTEHKYERFERAIFGTIQKSDETHSSYIARHEVQYEDLLGLGATLEEMRAYILLRNSGLNPEDKKRVIVDANGNLQYQKVIEAIQLLGSRFFNEVQSGTSRTAGRMKTYDVNFVDEPGDVENVEYGETVLYSTEAWEEYAFETLSQEGDEDCLLMQQFEDALVESLQGDAEIASCLNTYVEARQRLLDKAKSRGFWGGRSQKGKSKGKSKGSFGQRFRQPLAQRIMNSTCRICGVRGHWKAECPNNPMRDQSKSANNSSSTGSRTTAFAGMTMAEIPEHITDDDVDGPPDHAVAFTVQAWTQPDFRGFLSRSKVPINNDRRRVNPIDKPGLRKDGVFPNINLQPMVNHFRSLIRPTTSESRDTTKSCSNDPLIQQETRIEVSAESVFFASQGTFGIVDLGASLSVIGNQQFEDLCQALPESVLSRMKEAPCAVNFRFGNDSTVIGDRAIYFPVQQYWIKVVVVPSNTPFLIANSVFRSLGAVIDTEDNIVFFKKLQKRIPIQLSDRKLYRLDFAELLTSYEPEMVKNNSVIQPELICQITSETDKINTVVNSPLKENQHRSVGNAVQCDSNNQQQLEAKPEKSRDHRPKPEPWFEDTPSRDRVRSCLTPEPQHVAEPVRSIGQPPQEAEHLREPGEGSSRLYPEHDLHRAEGPSYGLWNSPSREEVQRGGVQHQVCHLVRGILQAQPETDTPEVSSICVPPCRSTGTSNREEPIQVGSPKQSCSQGPISAPSHSGQRQLPGDRSVCGTLERIRSGGRGTVEPGVGGQQSGTPPDAGSPTTDGECHGPGTRSSEQVRSCPIESIQLSVDSDKPSLIVDEKTQSLFFTGWEEFISTNCAHSPKGVTPNIDVGDDIYLCNNQNWVAKEMWNYMKSVGVHEGSQKGRNIHSFLMEIYCSSDSQLVKQAQIQGYKADRHGLKQGDLREHSSRIKLYDRLLKMQPQHVWMSPRCKAWCKWSTFNMHKNPDTAQKVIQAREEDQIHLLLCDAIYQFQSWRNIHCHFHLEQPQGSEMIAQEELASIVDQLLCARCDMCVAGQLKHPESGEYLKKGTQVWTSSPLMYEVLNRLKCPRDHSHSTIEGSVRLNQQRVNLSQFTELYTTTFARRLVRCMVCSAKVKEPSCVQIIDSPVLVSESNEPTMKRRRIEDKQKPPEGYSDASTRTPTTLESITQKALEEAPKVGKRWITEGPLLAGVQELFPNYCIHAVELCKGADRFRRPHSSVTKRNAPWRMTFGIHRQTGEIFREPQWEDWSALPCRQQTRKCSPSRLLVTVFAQLQSQPTPDENQYPGIHKRGQEPQEEDHPNKRYKIQQETERPQTGETQQDEIKSHSTKHGPKFMQLTSDQRQQLVRMHNNLGHPDSTVLGNILRDQQWPTEAIEGIKDLHCPACFETQRPKIARPSHLSKVREFNELVMIDGVEWTSASGSQFFFYHVLDSGTNFHIAFSSPSRDTSSVIDLLGKHWIAWAGPPQQIMTDSAGEFCSEEFSRYLQSQDTKLHVIPGEGHWQMGKCERHGAILQSMLNKYQVDHPITHQGDFEQALVHIVGAKNSISRHRGYSPEILVLGKSRHMPISNSADDMGSADWFDNCPDNPDSISLDSESRQFRINLDRRECARKAFMSADVDQKIRRAYLQRSRPMRDHHEVGSWVMYWRNGKGNLPGQWNGPARVVLQDPQNTIWLSHSSRLFRCAPEQVRNLSDRESSKCDLNSDPFHEWPKQLGTPICGT